MLNITNREIDLLLAEKVMGYVRTDFKFLNIHDAFDVGEGRLKPFRPSENISDAWKVMEKLNDQYDYSGVYWNRGTKHYECSFNAGEETVKSFARTASEVICLAALKVVAPTHFMD